MYQRLKRSLYVEIQREPNCLEKCYSLGKIRTQTTNVRNVKRERLEISKAEDDEDAERVEGRGARRVVVVVYRLSSITFGYRADADYLLRKCSVVLTAIPIASEERSGAALMRLWASRGPPPSASSAPPRPSAARRPPPPPPHPPPPGSLDPRFFFSSLLHAPRAAFERSLLHGQRNKTDRGGRGGGERRRRRRRTASETVEERGNDREDEESGRR